MATAKTALSQVFSRDVVYQTFRRSRWLNVFNRSWESEFEMGYKVQIPDLTDNIQIDEPDVGDAGLGAAPTFRTASLTNIELEADYIRGTAKFNLDEVKNRLGSAEFESELAMRLAIKLAIRLDDKLGAVVAGNAFTGGNGNDITVGAAGSVFVPRTAPYTPNAASIKLVPDALKAAHLNLYRKNAIDGEYTGTAQPSMVAAVMPPEIAKVLTDYLESIGELSNRASVAGQAAADLGIFGTSAYMGTYADMDIVAANEIAVPVGNANWAVYVLPTNSAAAAGVSEPETSDNDFRDGTTGGAYVWQRTVIQRWGAKILRPGHIVRVNIHAD